MLHHSHPPTLQDQLDGREHKLHRRSQRWERWHGFAHQVWLKWTSRRLVVGLMLAAALIATALPGASPLVAAVTFFVLLPAFIGLVLITARVRAKVTLADKLRTYYERQRERLNGTFSDPSRAAEEEEDPDLQRTGEKSLLSQMDESFSVQGRTELKTELFEFKPVEETRRTQALMQSLSKFPWPIARWLVTGQGASVDLKRIDGLFKSFAITAQDRLHSYISIAAFLLFLGMLFVLGPDTPLVWYVFFLQGIIHLAYLPRASRLLHRALELGHHWYHIDQQTRLLFKKDFWKSSFPQSFIFNKFSSRQSSRLKTLIGFADINNHPILSIFVHLAFPWLPVVCLGLGRFMEKWKVEWPGWRSDFLKIEKTASMAVFSHWQGVSYPVFSQEVEIEAKNIYHPLIERRVRVANDVAFIPPMKMVLLSGSNMAGKSTFLRTLALNQILATAGLPVFAEKLTTFHGPVLSCIQISDSLRDGFSYFMSEVLRLSEVLKKAGRADQPALAVIDEIFRGTNNRERHLGSQSVIQKLTSTPSLSIVSTHDLELTRLAEGNPKVENFHFREDYEGEKMTFHYKLHPGPSPTTNALKIMTQYGLY